MQKIKNHVSYLMYQRKTCTIPIINITDKKFFVLES